MSTTKTRYTRSVIALGAALFLLAASASSASALYLTKPEARTQVKYFVHERALRYNWPTGEWTEPASRCSRSGPLTVVCDYELYDDNRVDDAANRQYGCTGNIRIHEDWRWYYAKVVRQHCGWIFYAR